MTQNQTDYLSKSENFQSTQRKLSNLTKTDPAIYLKGCKNIRGSHRIGFLKSS